jgi:predicted alpha/beta superfamily hydrolase
LAKLIKTNLNKSILKTLIILIYFLFLGGFLYAQNTLSRTRVGNFTLQSKELGYAKKMYVYLPKDYESSDKRYPVIYMHDGQNLFDKELAFAGEWNVDETLDSINAKVIIIGIEHGGDKRIAELTPFTNEKYGGGNGDNYLKFIVETLKPHVDSIYRTKPNKKNTALFGSSLGGLISYYGVLKYPEVFGKAGVFSPAFWINRNDILEATRNTKKLQSKIYFLCGDKEGSDDDMVNDLNSIELQINTIRCSCLHLNKKVIVKDGQHNEKLWREGFKNAYLWLF